MSESKNLPVEVRLQQQMDTSGAYIHLNGVEMTRIVKALKHYDEHLAMLKRKRDRNKK
jgi:hypothetical protein